MGKLDLDKILSLKSEFHFHKLKYLFLKDIK